MNVDAKEKRCGELIEKSKKIIRETFEKFQSKDDTFKFEAESEAGNHLMKTVVFNQFVEKHNTKGMFIALRWDEQPARKNDECITEKEGVTKVMASLARDLIAGRPTDRESVFGFAVREGEAKNLPMTFTKYVYALTTAIEQNLE